MSDSKVTNVLRDTLTVQERQSGVAYLRREPMNEGETFSVSQISITTVSVCHLAFVDPSPSAYWATIAGLSPSTPSLLPYRRMPPAFRRFTRATNTTGVSCTGHRTYLMPSFSNPNDRKAHP